jgi:RES domain-containing protein
LTSQYDEVEVKSEYDKKVDARLREAKKPEIIQQLRVFHDFLSLYPYLGLADPAGTGKHIFDTVGAWPRVQLNSQEWYRARLIDQESRIFCSDEMCSPDPVKVSIKEGRYNHTGQSFLYLADSQDTAFNEIKRNKENICAMQKFVPDEPINVLDLTPHLGDLDLNMDMMALAIIYNGYVNKHPDYDSSWKPEYFVPRFIADCARLNSYDGILFSSAVSFGNNLVVFEEKRDLFKSNGPCEIYKWEKRTNGIMMSFFGYDDLLE